MGIIILIAGVFLQASVHAATIEGKQFPDSVHVKGKKLVLNGVGLRTKKKLGMAFKVYAGALYVPAKTGDASAIINGGDKVVELIFLRGLDKKTLQDAWSDAYAANCQVECDKAAQQVKAFNAMMADVKEDSRLKLTFNDTGVVVELTAVKGAQAARIENAALAKNLMAVFVGPKPPTEELKKGLLGL